MKNIKEMIVGIFMILIFVGACGVFVFDGVEHYKLTKGVVWNNNLQELRHKHGDTVVKVGIIKTKLAWETTQDALVLKVTGNPRSLGRTFDYRCELNRLEVLEARYRIGHNRTLAATLARDLWIAGDPQLFEKAYKASAL